MAIENWDQITEYYETAVGKIRILPMLDGQNVRQIVALLDEVLNSAFFDLSKAQDEYEIANARLQTLTSEAFLQGKDTPDAASRGGGGMSDEKAKAYSRKVAAESGAVDAKITAQRQLNFMENVVKLLQEKRALLVISYGTIKIESSLM
jgi:hypothetical protein